jgi:hypothetical protein
MVLAACAPASSTASTVVASTCAPPPAAPYRETITSTATPSRPGPGATVRFELGVRRLQIDVGPLTGATYVFPIPDGVAQVRQVEFADTDPHTWTARDGELTVEFRGPGGGWLVNDFPRLTVVAVLSPALHGGDAIAWKPYRRFEQRFLSVDTPLACTVADPGQVLQTMVVRGP